MKLGINNCFAVKRWPLAEEWARIVSQELELDLVQHSTDVKSSDPQEIRGACERFGLSVSSVFTGLIAYSMNLLLSPSPAERDRAMEFWLGGIRLASELGASAFGGHVGSLSRADADDPARREQLWHELRDRLAELAVAAGDHGLDTLLVENMASDREPSLMPEVSALMRPLEQGRARVALCLDIGHQCVPGSSGAEADPYAWLRDMGRYATVIHLQQSDAHADHHWPFTAEYNRLGRIEAPRVLEALRAGGAQDAELILEIVPPFEAEDARVLDELRQSVDYWKAAIDA